MKIFFKIKLFQKILFFGNGMNNKIFVKATTVI